MQVEFDSEAHEYFVDGERWPSVTQILSGVGLGYQFHSEKATARGRFVHAALHQHHRGTYNRKQPLFTGFIEAGISFCKREGFISLYSERILLLRRLKVCGTLDRFGYFQRWPNKRVVIDWKTGDVPPWTALQLAAYTAGLESIPDLEIAGDVERIAVRLYDDGTYDPVRFDPNPRQDRITFAAIATEYRWRALHGLLKEAA